MEEKLTHDGVVFGAAASVPPTITFSTFPAPPGVVVEARPEPVRPLLRLVENVRDACEDRPA